MDDRLIEGLLVTIAGYLGDQAGVDTSVPPAESELGILAREITEMIPRLLLGRRDELPSPKLLAAAMLLSVAALYDTEERLAEEEEGAGHG